MPARTNARTVLLVAALCCTVCIGCRRDAPPEGGLPGLLGEQLVDRSKSRVAVGDLQGKKVGIYFSAHWCPPCRAFTPRLVQVYEELRSTGKPFEIVFVSSDRDEASMLDYMREAKMPWLAVPFGDPRIARLKAHFGIRGIPTLVVVDDGGRTVTTDGRSAVATDGAAAFDRW